MDGTVCRWTVKSGHIVMLYNSVEMLEHLLLVGCNDTYEYIFYE